MEDLNYINMRLLRQIELDVQSPILQLTCYFFWYVFLFFLDFIYKKRMVQRDPATWRIWLGKDMRTVTGPFISLT